jgi:hypothetical protein
MRTLAQPPGGVPDVGETLLVAALDAAPHEVATARTANNSAAFLHFFNSPMPELAQNAVAAAIVLDPLDVLAVRRAGPQSRKDNREVSQLQINGSP